MPPSRPTPCGGRPTNYLADPDVQRLVEAARDRLADTHKAREAGLPACRRVIQASGRAIRAVHRRQDDEAARLLDEAGAALAEAHEALGPHPAVFFAGFLHDAEKEYAEARMTATLVAGAGHALPGIEELGVQPAAWLNGLAEAASELRRHALDRLRNGEIEVAESLLTSMDDVYDALVTIDFPDAITGGLRRTTDALRAVLERTRSDLTLTTVQARLSSALERGATQ